MAYVIAQPCVGVKDGACVEVCPMDCIRTNAGAPQMYINPNECTECGACEVVCPTGAIFEDSLLPTEWRHFEQINAQFFEKYRGGRGKPRPPSLFTPQAVLYILKSRSYRSRSPIGRDT